MPTKTTTNTTTAVPQLPERFADLATPLQDLANDVVAGIADSETDVDTFGPLAPAAAFLRSVPVSEGALLEAGLRLILEASGHFILFADVNLPISEAARQAVRSNDAKALAGIGLEANVYAPENYAADIIAVDRRTDIAFIIELKRCTTNYSGNRMKALQQTLLAAALQGQDVLWRQHNRTATKAMRVLLLDCADQDRRDEVVRLSELDEVLDVSGLAAAMQFLRRCFGQAVQAAFMERFHAPLVVADVAPDPDTGAGAENECRVANDHRPVAFASDDAAHEPLPFQIDVGFAGAGRG